MPTARDPAQPDPAAVESGSGQRAECDPAEMEAEPGAQRSADGGPGRLRLRPLTVADLPLMCRWIGAPHVHRWWHDSSEPAAVSAEYLPCIEGSEPSHPLIAELPTGPVAFVQWYRWTDYPDYAGKVGAAPDELGFDYLIGEPELCGRGLGTRLIGALMDHILARERTVGGFVVDPEQANTASRRVLEKNGFQLVAIAQLADPQDRQTGPTAIYRLRLTAAGPAGSAAHHRISARPR
jgi:aminoglycoside 6'-N-acetyltransferase